MSQISVETLQGKLCLEMVAKEMHLSGPYPSLSYVHKYSALFFFLLRRYGEAPGLTFHSFHPGSAFILVFFDGFLTMRTSGLSMIQKWDHKANTKLMRQGSPSSVFTSVSEGGECFERWKRPVFPELRPERKKREIA